MEKKLNESPYFKKLRKICEDAEKKRKALEEKMKVKIKVHVLTAGEDIEPCVIFLRPAGTFVKMQCWDLMKQGGFSRAYAAMLEATLIQEESDKRVLIKDNDEDDFYLGALKVCEKSLTYATDFIKKK